MQRLGNTLTGTARMTGVGASLSDPAPIHAFGNGTGDFVTDCPEELGHIISGQNFIPLGSNEYYLIPHRDARIGAKIDHELVHADPTDDGMNRSSNEDVPFIRQPSGQSVGVTDGDGGDFCRFTSGPCPAVADGIPRIDSFNEGDVTDP